MQDEHETESDEDETYDVEVVAPGIGRATRGFAGMPEECKTMPSMAQRVIAYHTLY